MKKILFAAVVTSILVGCEEQIQAKYDAITGEKLPETASIVRVAESAAQNIYKFSYDGHDYLIARGIKSISMIHSESCKCKASCGTK